MYNKLLFTISAVFLLQFQAISQFSGGIVAGINHADQRTVNFPNYFRVQPRTDFFSGLTTQFDINHRWRVSTDLLYSREGFKILLQQDDSESLTLRVVKVKSVSEAEYRLFPFLSLGAGAFFSVNTNTQGKVNDGEWEGGRYYNDFVEKYDWGITGKIKLEYKGLFAFTRYNWGVINVSTLSYTDDSGSTIPTQQFNRNLQIGVGYVVALNKNKD